MKVGDQVWLRTPDNPRINGKIGVVEEFTDYGAVVATKAAGSGRFRALRSEMEAVNQSKLVGYTGDVCRCGSVRMVRNGACLLCLDCGESSGCS